jgi:hypothetical protein
MALLHSKITGHYKGVSIIYRDGIYSPITDGNVECTSVRQVEKWIDTQIAKPKQPISIFNIPKHQFSTN